MTDASKAALWANQEHYAQRGAFDYVTNAYHARRIHVASGLLAKHLSSSAKDLILVDIGPGETSPVNLARHPRATRIAIDATDNALRRADGFSVRVCADVTDGLPLRDGRIDAIYCGELIEHLFDPRDFLHECYRVLAPGGFLIITTPNIATLQDRVRFLFGRAPRHIDPLHDYIRLHIRPFTPELLARTFRDAGLVPLETRSNYVDFHVRGKRYNVALLARIAPRLGGTIILLGAKPKD